mmetsp:Transcript_44580/g.129638  ORF Transcript_44580/g.129638 Transcript_44580/m.129638 type:complete len:463 (-) Transcript_44580:1919-3307(-)
MLLGDVQLGLGCGEALPLLLQLDSRALRAAELLRHHSLLHLRRLQLPLHSHFLQAELPQLRARGLLGLAALLHGGLLRQDALVLHLKVVVRRAQGGKLAGRVPGARGLCLDCLELRGALLQLQLGVQLAAAERGALLAQTAGLARQGVVFVGALRRREVDLQADFVPPELLHFAPQLLHLGIVGVRPCLRTPHGAALQLALQLGVLLSQFEHLLPHLLHALLHLHGGLRVLKCRRRPRAQLRLQARVLPAQGGELLVARRATGLRLGRRLRRLLLRGGLGLVLEVLLGLLLRALALHGELPLHLLQGLLLLRSRALGRLEGLPPLPLLAHLLDAVGGHLALELPYAAPRAPAPVDPLDALRAGPAPHEGGPSGGHAQGGLHGHARRMPPLRFLELHPRLQGPEAGLHLDGGGADGLEALPLAEAAELALDAHDEALQCFADELLEAALQLFLQEHFAAANLP